jgi:hypothetical protein
LPITAVRTYQALYKNEINKVVLTWTEIAVELLRIVQYILYIAYGTNTPISMLLTGSAWGTMFVGVRQLSLMPFVWDLIGFIVVFGIYNVILFAILRKPVVEKWMDKTKIRSFEVTSVRTAIMLAYKNLLLIPVSMIYLFDILQIF